MSMFFIIINFILEYFSYFIGGLIQLLFMLLPVMLKNWEDDLFNCLTYVFFQMFVAGIIYIISPWVLESKEISMWVQILLIFGSGFIAFFRVIILIPFEFTYPIKLKILQEKGILFLGFHTNERYRALASLDFKSCEAELRYNAFREKLMRVKMKKADSDFDDDFDED